MIVIAAGAGLAACVEKPPPRSFTEFMDDTIAREGTLVRCNADRAATADDPECVNARRAAAALAARAEAAERDRLQALSEARLLAARQRYEAQQEAERQAEIAARAEEDLAYEALWDDSAGAAAPESPPTVTTPLDGATPGAGSVGTDASLEPIALPSSVRPPLATVTLPRGAKPIEHQANDAVLEEIVLPDRRQAD